MWYMIIVLISSYGAINYDYIITNSTICLLIGSRCFPYGAHTNHWANLAHASKCIKNSAYNIYTCIIYVYLYSICTCVIQLISDLPFIHPSEVALVNKVVRLGSYYQSLREFITEQISAVVTWTTSTQATPPHAVQSSGKLILVWQ